MATYKVSSDGKTVSVGKETFTLTAFKKRFQTEDGISLNAGRKGYAYLKNVKPPIKINTKPGKTTVSPMAKARGRIVGGGLGGMFGIKNR